MTQDPLQLLDAMFLIGIVMCVITLMQRNYREAPVILRLALAAFAFQVSGQAAWVLGIWAPDSVGFPWPRATMDGSMLVLGVLHILVPSVFAHTDVHQRHQGNAAN